VKEEFERLCLRFAQLMRYFCGRGGGALESHGTIGHPGRISFCIAEHPVTVWPPFHTQFGLPAETAAVTVMATEGPNSVNNHYAQTGALVLETIVPESTHRASGRPIAHVAADLGLPSETLRKPRC
jgi:hypothetical protein